MANGRNPDRLPVVDQLIDDPVGADPERSKPLQATSQQVAGFRFALEESERVLDGVDQRPTELEDLSERPAGQDDSGQRGSTRPACSELPTDVVEADGLARVELGHPRVNRMARFRI